MLVEAALSEIDREVGAQDPVFAQAFAERTWSEALQFAYYVVNTMVKTMGRDALELTLPFDEKVLLQSMEHIIIKQLGIQGIYHCYHCYDYVLLFHHDYHY